MKKHSDKSKSNSDAGSSFERVEPQSSGIKGRASICSGQSSAAEEPTPPEQVDLTEALALLPFPAPSLELIKKMIADSVSLRTDEDLKDLAKNQSLFKEQALRLAELEEKLKALSSAAHATRKVASELVVPQP